jgi:nucleotide-binding universal stress UspA family protein
LAAETGARVGLVHVLDVSRGFSPEFGFVDEAAVARLRPFGEELLDRAAAAVSEAGVPVDRIVHEGDPPHEIVAAADRWGADLLVVGTHGHGRLARLLNGYVPAAVGGSRRLRRRRRSLINPASGKP